MSGHRLLMRDQLCCFVCTFECIVFTDVSAECFPAWCQCCIEVHQTTYGSTWLHLHISPACEASAETRLVPSSGKSSQMSTALTQPVPCATAITGFSSAWPILTVSFCELKSKWSSEMLFGVHAECQYQYFTTLVLIEEIATTPCCVPAPTLN